MMHLHMDDCDGHCSKRRRRQRAPAGGRPNWRAPPAVQEVEVEVASDVTLSEHFVVVEAIHAEPAIRPEVQQAADADNLTLVRAPGTASGFKGVCLQRSGRKDASGDYYYVKQTLKGTSGKQTILRDESGAVRRFYTAADAALVYARLLGPQESARQARDAPRPGTYSQAKMTDSATYRPSMAAAEVFEVAAQEGLQLLADRKYATGFRGVSEVRSRRTDNTRNFIAKVYNPYAYLGTFGSPEEAALCIARYERARARQPSACASGTDANSEDAAPEPSI